MTTTKKLSMIFILGLIITIEYVQYKKCLFDIIYENRDDHFSMYQSLYKSGKLDTIRSFLTKNYASLTSSRDMKHPIIYLSSIQTLTKDSSVVSAANNLLDLGFYSVHINCCPSLKYELRINRLFLEYKSIPTYHCIKYTKRFGTEYRFDSDDYWYYYSFDKKDHTPQNFLNVFPKWSLPYFEAFHFFTQNTNNQQPNK